MAQPIQRIRIEEIDWLGVFPWLRLFSSFRMAIQPPVLLVSLLLVFLLYMGGWVLDGLWGPSCEAGEANQYLRLTPESFNAWRQGRPSRVREGVLEQVQRSMPGNALPPAMLDMPVDQLVTHALTHVRDYYASQRLQIMEITDLSRSERIGQLNELQQQRRLHLAAIRTYQHQGVFAVAMSTELDAFNRLVRSAIAMRMGFTELLTGSVPAPDSVLGALRDMTVGVPGWVFMQHRWFLVAYLGYGLVIWSLLGGIVSRMVSLHACVGEPATIGPAAVFCLRRWIWFIVAPLLPLGLVVCIATVLALGGLVFFNLPVFDVLGGLLYGVALLMGLIAVMLLLGWVVGLNMLYPSMTVEGSDAFDAASRAYNYVLGRPWKWLLYNLLALVFGAICYLLVAVVVLLTLRLTQGLVSLGSVSLDRQVIVQAMMPPPNIVDLADRLDLSNLSLSTKISAVLLSIWVYGCLGLLAAFAISFFLSANTWIYLLLRRSADGTEFDDLLVESTAPATPLPSPSPDTPETPEAPETPETPEAANSAPASAQENPKADY